MTRPNTVKSFKIPASLELEMNKKVIADGYGMKGKSRWISDMLIKFLNCQDESFILECIGYSEELERLEKTVSFRLSALAEESLSRWVVKARVNMPMLEGVKSKIIRTSIIHGLLGSTDSIARINTMRHDSCKNATL